VNVTISASDDIGVARIKLYVNGKQVFYNEPYAKAFAKTLTIWLNSGNNRIEVEAEDTSGQKASDSTTVNIILISPPDVKITYPLDGETFIPGDPAIYAVSHSKYNHDVELIVDGKSIETFSSPINSSVVSTGWIPLHGNADLTIPNPGIDGGYTVLRVRPVSTIPFKGDVKAGVAKSGEVSFRVNVPYPAKINLQTERLSGIVNAKYITHYGWNVRCGDWYGCGDIVHDIWVYRSDLPKGAKVVSVGRHITLTNNGGFWGYVYRSANGKVVVGVTKDPILSKVAFDSRRDLRSVTVHDGYFGSILFPGRTPETESYGYGDDPIRLQSIDLSGSYIYVYREGYSNQARIPVQVAVNPPKISYYTEPSVKVYVDGKETTHVPLGAHEIKLISSAGFKYRVTIVPKDDEHGSISKVYVEGLGWKNIPANGLTINRPVFKFRFARKGDYLVNVEYHYNKVKAVQSAIQFSGSRYITMLPGSVEISVPIKRIQGPQKPLESPKSSTPEKGWIAKYYANEAWKGTPVVKTDVAIDISDSNGWPKEIIGKMDVFSVEWRVISTFQELENTRST